MNLNRIRSASRPVLIIKTVGALPVLRDLCLVISDGEQPKSSVCAVRQEHPRRLANWT